jgi:hypothetical protein
LRDHAHTLSDFRVPTLSIEYEPAAGAVATTSQSSWNGTATPSCRNSCTCSQIARRRDRRASTTDARRLDSSLRSSCSESPGFPWGDGSSPPRRYPRSCKAAPLLLASASPPRSVPASPTRPRPFQERRRCRFKRRVGLFGYPGDPPVDRPQQGDGLVHRGVQPIIIPAPLGLDRRGDAENAETPRPSAAQPAAFLRCRAQ